MKYISKYTFITLIFIFSQFGCSSNIEKFGMNESTQIPRNLLFDLFKAIKDKNIEQVQLIFNNNEAVAIHF